MRLVLSGICWLFTNKHSRLNTVQVFWETQGNDCEAFILEGPGTNSVRIRLSNLIVYCYDPNNSTADHASLMFDKFQR